MFDAAHDSNEKLAAAAFGKQSLIFDDIYGGDKIIQYKRSRVRSVLQQFLQPGDRILELNAGTGEDAIYFAEQGYNVHATDISQGMQDRLVEKVLQKNLTQKISAECCSFTMLNQLNNQGPYDAIFSNFAGLNCTGELDKVLSSFNALLKQGGIVTLVILPKFCLWETALVLKGKFKTASRRFFSSKGVKAKIDKENFTCWYYSPSFIVRSLGSKYELADLQGLCTIVPPSYIEHFGDRHPEWFSRLCRMEDKLKNKWPWKCIGDYYIITLRKK